MDRIVVFCGSSKGIEPEFVEHAYQLGSELARRRIGLVYGGARIGIMGAVATGALNGGGEVIGVLPGFLSGKEIAHDGLSELIIVKSMHERKMKMNELCDGAIALPGGFGTMEEFFEMLTWGQLGLHKKPVGILNIKGFYGSLIDLIQTMVDKSLLKEVDQKMLLVDTDIAALLNQMESYKAPPVGKWIKLEST